MSRYGKKKKKKRERGRAEKAAGTHRAVEHGGDEVVPDALHLVLRLIRLVKLLGLRQDGAFWVNGNYLRAARTPG